MQLTSDKRRYLYYLMDFTTINDSWNEKIRDILYSGKDYNDFNIYTGISLGCKIKPMSLSNFIRDDKIRKIFDYDI